MGLNLSGLCGADPTACHWKPPGSAVPPSPAAVAGPTPAQAAHSAYGPAIMGFLYRLTAFLGCRGICPALPTLGVVIAETIGLPAEILVGPVAIPVAVFGSLVGQFLKDELCSTCR